tara:strand:+ start:754 stop:948 length:195 start_codon:yes stop_codon:yes gene_type:complete
MVKYKVYFIEDDIKKEQEYESNKAIGEIFDDFEQGKVWRVDILEDDIKINPKRVYDYSKVKEVE